MVIEFASVWFSAEATSICLLLLDLDCIQWPKPTSFLWSNSWDVSDDALLWFLLHVALSVQIFTAAQNVKVLKKRIKKKPIAWKNTCYFYLFKVKLTRRMEFVQSKQGQWLGWVKTMNYIGVGSDRKLHSTEIPWVCVCAVLYYTAPELSLALGFLGCDIRIPL